MCKKPLKLKKESYELTLQTYDVTLVSLLSLKSRKIVILKNPEIIPKSCLFLLVLQKKSRNVQKEVRQESFPVRICFLFLLPSIFASTLKKKKVSLINISVCFALFMESSQDSRLQVCVLVLKC